MYGCLRQEFEQLLILMQVIMLNYLVFELVHIPCGYDGSIPDDMSWTVSSFFVICAQVLRYGVR